MDDVICVNHPDKLARPLAEQLEEAEATDKVFICLFIYYLIKFKTVFPPLKWNKVPKLWFPSHFRLENLGIS